MRAAALPAPLSALRRLARDRFLLGMAAAVLLAVLLPGLGRSGGPLHADLLADAGIFLVFLLHGLGLSPAALAEGARRWRLHLFVQAFTFGLFPLLWLLADALAGRWLPPALSLGFLYLCAVPSTISSSVAFTAVARGNVPGAIFDASLSSALGVVLTPLLLRVLGHTQSQALPLGEAVGKLALLLLLPLALGQALRPLLGARAERIRRSTHGVDRAVILLLVYASFCDSVATGVFTRYGYATVGIALVGSLALLAFVLWLSTVTSRALGFTKEDEIAAVFCGSKKTLASGVPMARLLFGADPALGLIVLPLMLYHQAQLFVCSLMAERYARRLQDPP
ncbi:bile acid:sodium symporter [Aggregicoccus sp. 17bor-14]|uniref:bile acid:sodium symporter family protein n=1 Tax=Myxococcaceae TaxID=31 RepID=UPI00129C1E10|nr:MULTISPECIES: bile acid:sodium symporter family protein [Myxococcaceae]MBF5046588.1 bile acid:sodium symporter [Simulacricoccus sp. 17bor-14]MRI92299.1 bile acid:sodium symporter [Aggregicoccus sp. 17bor-14]